MDAENEPPVPPEAPETANEPEPEPVPVAPAADEPGGQIELPLDVEPAEQRVPEPEPLGPDEADPRTVLLRLVVFVAVAVLAVVALVMLALWRPKESEPEREIRAAIETVIESDASFATAVGAPIPAPFGPDTAWTVVRELYHRRHANPVWWSQAEPTPAARRFATTIARVESEGLDPAAYAIPGIERLAGVVAYTPAAAAPDTHARRLPGALTATEIAHLDLRMSLAFVRMGFHLIEGRVPDAQLDPSWRSRQRPPDLARALVHGVRDDRVAEELHALVPPADQYLRLRDALARYRALADLGDWQELDKTGDLKRGSHGAVVAQLRARLLREGDIDSANAHGTEFDRPLERSVRRFQSRYGLPPNGVVDARTRTALNLPVAARVRQIEANLERWRWFHVPLEPRSVRVNIPDFTVALWDSGRVRTTMPVVIGRRQSPTPIFSDSITYIEVNPTWRLPKNVLENEILPEMKKDPDYPAKHQMRLFYTHSRLPMPEVPWDQPDWTHLWQDSFPYMAIQDPGNDNPLGHIKFMCPNEYDVYLHDSNAPGLFGAPRRAYSHGCVRVGRPMDFAAFVLGDTSSQLALIRDSLFVTGEHRLIRFKPPVPVHVMYWTAWVDTTGAVQFRDDLYGYDANLADYLARRQPRWRLNPDSLRTDWRARQRRGEIEP
jgi:murein L,D-transpeptidase YcbB/YkuD